MFQKHDRLSVYCFCMTHQNGFIYTCSVFIKADPPALCNFLHVLYFLRQLKFVLFHFYTLPRKDPHSKPTVEAPAKPLLPDEAEEEQPEEAHYDSLEKPSTTTESP